MDWGVKRGAGVLRRSGMMDFVDTMDTMDTMDMVDMMDMMDNDGQW